MRGARRIHSRSEVSGNPTLNAPDWRLREPDANPQWPAHEPKGRAGLSQPTVLVSHRRGALGQTRPTNAWFMAPMCVRSWRWRLPMNRSICRQVLDCGDGVCAIAALECGAMSTSPNSSQSGDSLRSSPQSKTLARHSPHLAGSWPRFWRFSLLTNLKAGRITPCSPAQRPIHF